MVGGPEWAAAVFAPIIKAAAICIAIAFVVALGIGVFIGWWL